eukprot:scaffold2.g7207.t1
MNEGGGKLSARGSRRGGVGDAGGLGRNGELPVAVAVAVHSDAELATEVEAAAVGLAATADWVQRVEALLRLEGLVKGGAAERPALLDLLLGLRNVLSAQLQDRRSAVSRQACHVVAVLAAACGDRFEALAAYLLPVLFKTLAMGIQVVNEAADSCAHTMLRHCQSAKLLPKLCTTVAGDRSGKLRQSAAEYLLHVVEEWPPTVYERQAEELERAILAAARDAQAETRGVGRTMFAAYARACSGPASALLLHLESTRDKALADKLAAAMQSYVPGASLAFAFQPTSRRASTGSTSEASSPRSGQGLLRTGSGVSVGRQEQQQAATARENLPDNMHEPAAATMAGKPPIGRRPAGPGGAPAPRPHTAWEHAAARRSMGGAALRISLAAAREELAQEEGAAASTISSRMPRRVSVNPGALRVMRPVPSLPIPPAGLAAQPLPAGDRPLSAQSSGIADLPPSIPESDPSGTLLSACSYCEEPAAAPLSQLLAQAAKAGLGWSTRVEQFQALEAAVSQGGLQAVADMSTNAERLVAVLLDGAGDAHFRVAAAALQALGAGLAGQCARVFEPHLDRIVPLLFSRVTDSKEQIRGLVAAALASLPVHHHADAVVSAMAKALQTNKGPRVRCAVLDHYSGAALSPRQQGLLTGQGYALRALLAVSVPLLGDKNPEVRRAAARMVATALKAADSHAVAAALAALPMDAAEAAGRAVAAAVPSLDLGRLPARPPAALVASTSAAGGDAAAPAATAATASVSRRWSGEGLASSRGPSRSSSSLAGATDAEATTHSARAASPQPQAPSLPPARAEAQAPLPPPQLPAAGPVPALPHVEQTAAPAALAGLMQDGTGAAEPEQKAPLPQPAGASAAPSTQPQEAGTEDQLRRLLAQLQGRPASEVLQGLSQLARVLPPVAWSSHFQQILAAVCIGLDSGHPLLQEAAATLVRDLASVTQPPQFDPALPTLLPRLLACAAQQDVREAAVAADTALGALLARADPAACIALLAQRLPPEEAAQSADNSEAAALHAVVRNLRRALAQSPPAALASRLDLLLPGLRAAYRSPLADVRKATVDCLVALRLAVGADTLAPHMEGLSASQRKLLDIYIGRALAAAGALAGH